MTKQKERIVELLEDLSKLEQETKEQKKTDSPVPNLKDNSIRYNEDYWKLKSIQSNVFEFVVNTEQDGVVSDVKMYLIPNQNVNILPDKNYYSIITVAYNSEKQATVSNYSVDHSENILKNYEIDIDYLIMEHMYEKSTKIDPTQVDTISDHLALNINIIKSALKDKETLKEVLSELLLYITEGFDENEHFNIQ